MGKLLRKSLSVLLSALLAVYSFPIAALAEPSKKPSDSDVLKRVLDPLGKQLAGDVARDKASMGTALDYLKKQGVFKDEKDPVYSYLVSGGKLSPMGEVLYSYLRSLPNPGEEMEGIQDQLVKLRESGVNNAKKQAVVERVIGDYNEKFGKIADQSGSLEDMFRYGTLREAIMTGASVVDAPKKGFTQVETEDGWELWDKDGLAYKLNKNQVTTYNRDLQKSQRIMNQSRPPQSPFIPETGRYNHEMLQYSYYRLFNQHKELDKAYHIDRMINMAELLGKQYKDDMWFTDLTLEEDLVRWAKKKTFSHHGIEYSVFDIVEKKMQGRVAYLGKAKEGLARFEYEMDRMKGLQTVAEPRIQTLQMHEQYIMRFLSLSFLETQKYHVKNQLDRLDPRSPDSELIDKALLEAPLDEATKQRYQTERANLHRRVQALMSRLRQVQDVLLASDYAGNLDLVSAALNSAQKDLSEVSLDYSLFVEMPSLMFISKAQLGGFSMNNVGGWAVKAYWKLGIQKGHSAAMDQINGALPQYGKAAELLSRGDYWGARKIIAAIHPDAAYRRMESGLGGGSVKVTEPLKVAASLKQTRMYLAQVADTNAWVNAAGNYITWTVALALAAPIMSGVMSGVSKAAGYLNAPIARIPVLSLPLKAVEEASLHASIRLNSLSPAAQNIPNVSQNALLNGLWRYGAYSGVRFVNAAARQATFTALSGGISALFTMGGHYWDELVPEFDLWAISNDKDHSPFKTGWDAAAVGFKGGVVWANESWHPLLGYVGLPSSIYEGTVLSRPAEILGSQGAVGSAMEFLKSAGVPISEKLSLQTVSEMGLLGKVGSFALGMGDNLAKYVVFSNAVGAVASQYNWYSTRDELDLERRIKSAAKEKNYWLNSAVWLMLPVYPAKYQVMAADHVRAEQGKAEYDASGRRHEYANASEGADMPLLGKPKVPLLQKIFDLRWLGEVQEGATWKVTKEIKRQGMAAELVEALGGKGSKPADVNPLEFFKASQLGDGKTVGKLFMNDEVRLLAGEKFIESLAGKPGLVDAVLKAAPGTEIPGFGTVTPSIKREVALAVRLNSVKGVTFTPEAVAKATELMKPYFDADSVPKPAGKAFIEAVRANTKLESPALEKAVEDMWSSVADWKANKGKEGHPMFKKGYMDLVSDLKGRVDAAPDLTPAEKVSMKSLYEYLEAVEGRFNSFNKVGVVHDLATESLTALRTQFAKNKPVTDLLTSFEGKVKAWRTAEASADAPAVGPKTTGYRNMLVECMKELHGAKGTLFPADFDAVRAGLKEMEAAPWAVHDSKGSPLTNWRPEQFEAMMTSLGLITLMGRGGNSIREFLLLKTGGGKTMLVFEGLLPIAEADAAFHGMNVTFLTVQSNLEAQARLEFNAYKKVASKIEFMTYEEFKGKIAEKKLVAKDIVKKHWIFGDEGDGAALQPMLTIGETTAQISRAASAYKLLESIQKSMETRVGKGSVEIAEAVKAEIKRVQPAVDAVDARTPEGASLRQSMNKLLKAADRLAMARTPEEFALAKGNIESLLTSQQSALEASGPLKVDAKVMARMTANADKMLALADRMERAKKPEVVTKAATELEGLMRQQQALVDKADLAGTMRGTSIKSAAESLRAKLFNAVQADAPGLAASRADYVKMIRESAQTQRQALSAQVAAGPEQLAVLRQLQSKVMDHLSTRPEMDAGARARLVGEVEKALWQQRNLLGLTQRDMKAGVQDLWSGAAKEKAALQAKVDSVNRELTRLQGEIESAGKKGKSAASLESRADRLRAEKTGIEARLQFYDKFLSGSPELTQTRQGAGELRETALRRKEVLDQALWDTKEQLAQAKSKRQPTEALENRVLTLESELAAAKADLVKARTLSAPTKGDYAHVERLFRDDAVEIVDIIKEGKPGWEGSAMDRLAVRQKMLRSFAYSENPVYDVYRAMKSDMYSVALSTERLSEDPARAERAAVALNRKIDGQSLTGLTVSFLKNTVTGQSMKVEELGLTRIRGTELLKAIMSDPVMPYGQKMDLFWNIVPSILWPRGPTGKGGSWVRNELINMARGYFDNPANVRVDNQTGRINVIHNGQWFDSMDTPTRRWWELEYGTDLTLPYKHKTLSTIKDITDNKKARFILMSGTAGQELRRIMEARGIKFGGSPSKAPDNVALELKSGPSEKFARIKQALLESRAQSGDLVVVSPTAKGLPDAVKAHFEKVGVADQNSAVVKISDAPAEGGVRAFLKTARANQGPTSLTVLSLSDTRMIREVRKYLIKTGLTKPSEIAQVFSDTEFLREQRPQADVQAQMNLDGLNDGRVKILLLDTRVGGRGLDLNFKGDRENPDPKAFKGYTNYEMLLIDPHEMSAVHLLQAEGRIDVARVLPSAQRNFSLIMDVRNLQNQPLFREMVRNEGVFAELRNDPALQQYAKKLGRALDWSLIHDYMQLPEVAKSRAELLGRYNESVMKTLDARQLDVELEQLNSSSVGEKATKFDPKYRGLELGPQH
ncbi:MAG: hypothetical protein HY927_10135 [Elusimicrobia bacterium]|nr:hypothetical protein [Elusimicrobiota bacterium]